MSVKSSPLTDMHIASATVQSILNIWVQVKGLDEILTKPNMSSEGMSVGMLQISVMGPRKIGWFFT